MPDNSRAPRRRNFDYAAAANFDYNATRERQRYGNMQGNQDFDIGVFHSQQYYPREININNRQGPIGIYQYPPVDQFVQPMMMQYPNAVFGNGPMQSNPHYLRPFPDIPPMTLPYGFPGAPPQQPYPQPQRNYNFTQQPERVPLFVNPNLATHHHQIQCWQNSDGYVEYHGQQGATHFDTRNSSQSKPKLDYQMSNSDTFSSISSEVEEKKLPLESSLRAFHFNGLNFPMIARECMSPKEREEYEELLDEIAEQIKEFFRTRNKLWGNSDSRMRIAREDRICYENYVMEGKDGKKQILFPPIKLECFIPTKSIEIPKDSFEEVDKLGSNSEAKNEKETSMQNEKQPVIFEKKIDAQKFLKNLAEDQTSLFPVQFSKQELAELHHLLHSGQEVTVVMLAEFPSVGQSDSSEPEVPEDSADEVEIPPIENSEEELELPIPNSTESVEAPRYSRLSGFTDNTGTPNRGRSASNLGASNYARVYHAHYRPGHRRLPEIPREYLEAETATPNSPVTPPPPPASPRRVLPPTPRRRHQSHDSGIRIRNGTLPPAWMNEHPYLRFLIPTEEAFMARVPFPPYRIPLIGIARREPGQPFNPQRILPAHENYDQFRSRMRNLWDDNDDTTFTRGTGALCLEPRNLCLPTSAERAALLREFQDAEVEEAARRSGEPVIPGQKLPKEPELPDSEDPSTSSGHYIDLRTVMLLEEEKKRKKNERCNSIPPLHQYHRDSSDDDDNEGSSTCSGSPGSSGSSASISVSSTVSTAASDNSQTQSSGGKLKKERAVKDTAAKNQKRRERDNRRAARKEENRLQEEKRQKEQEAKEMKKKLEAEKKKARQEELDRQKAIEDQRVQEEIEKIRLEKKLKAEEALSQKTEKKKLRNQINKEKKRIAKKKQYAINQQKKEEELKMIKEYLEMKSWEDFDKSILEKLTVAKMALDADEKLHKAMKKEGINDEVLESILEPALLELADYEEINMKSIRERSKIINEYFNSSESFKLDVQQQLKCAEEGRYQMTKGICLLRQTEASRMFILTRDLKYVRAVRQYREWYTEMYEELSLFVNYIVGINEVTDKDPTIEKFEEWAVY